MDTSYIEQKGKDRKRDALKIMKKRVPKEKMTDFTNGGFILKFFTQPLIQSNYRVISKALVKPFKKSDYWVIQESNKRGNST